MGLHVDMGSFKRFDNNNNNIFGKLNNFPLQYVHDDIEVIAETPPVVSSFCFVLRKAMTCSRLLMSSKQLSGPRNVAKYSIVCSSFVICFSEAPFSFMN